MKMTKTRRFLSLIICIVLIAAMALFTNGCGKEKTLETPSEAPSQNQSQNVGDVKELGEGAVSFDFSVVDIDGKETKFIVHTDSKTVGEALMKVGLIEGEQGQYGLYVKKVNGITADYDVDKTYWAFYVNDEMASQGVDMTNITAGESYSFRISK